MPLYRKKERRPNSCLLFVTLFVCFVSPFALGLPQYPPSHQRLH
jgi:hypothetical protein